MVQKFTNLKQKTPALTVAKDCSSSIVPRKHFKDWPVDNMKKTGFNGYVYDFSVEYDATDVDKILDIHKYLMKNNNIV